MRSESSELRNRCITNIALNEADRFPDLYRRFRELVIEPRREAFREVLRRGVATGELRADLDVEVAMSMLVGAMLFHTKMCGAGLPGAPTTSARGALVRRGAARLPGGR